MASVAHRLRNRQGFVDRVRQRKRLPGGPGCGKDVLAKRGAGQRERLRDLERGACLAGADRLAQRLGRSEEAHAALTLPRQHGSVRQPAQATDDADLVAIGPAEGETLGVELPLRGKITPAQSEAGEVDERDRRAEGVAHRPEPRQGLAEAHLRAVEIALEIVDEAEILQQIRDPDRASSSDSWKARESAKTRSARDRTRLGRKAIKPKDGQWPGPRTRDRRSHCKSDSASAIDCRAVAASPCSFVSQPAAISAQTWTDGEDGAAAPPRARPTSLLRPLAR